MNSINHERTKNIKENILKKRKERTEKELGRFLIRSSLSSSDDFGVQKSNVNKSPKGKGKPVAKARANSTLLSIQNLFTNMPSPTAPGTTKKITQHVLISNSLNY